MRNAPLGWLFLILFCTSAPRPASLVDVKTRATRAGYTADLQALADAARDARAIAAADPAQAALAHYWAGYAFWQRAVNDVNLKLDPSADRAAALAEFEAALAARESFADAHALVAWLEGWLWSTDPANKDAHQKQLIAHHSRARARARQPARAVGVRDRAAVPRQGESARAHAGADDAAGHAHGVGGAGLGPAGSGHDARVHGSRRRRRRRRRDAGAPRRGAPPGLALRRVDPDAADRGEEVALARRGIPTAPAARAHPFPKLPPLLRRHLRVALQHPPAPRTPTSASKSGEEDLAQHQKADGLPVGDGVPSGHWRDDCVPQQLHEPAEDEEGGDGGDGDGDELCDSSHFPNSSRIDCSRLRRCSTAVCLRVSRVLRGTPVSAASSLNDRPCSSCATKASRCPGGSSSSAASSSSSMTARA